MRPPIMRLDRRGHPFGCEAAFRSVVKTDEEQGHGCPQSFEEFEETIVLEGLQQQLCNKSCVSEGVRVNRVSFYEMT